MTRILISLLTCGIIFAGCNNSTEKKEPVNTVPEITDQPVAEPVQLQAPADAAPGSAAPVTITAQPTQSQPGQQVNATATGMNPAHGEPGHRCDIAVGAPLNSPPGNKQAPVINSPVTSMPQSASPQPGPGPTMGNLPAPTPVTVNPSSAPTTTAAGMNPPHGQPGHDCSIAVGAPLKK